LKKKILKIDRRKFQEEFLYNLKLNHFNEKKEEYNRLKKRLKELEIEIKSFGFGFGEAKKKKFLYFELKSIR